MPCDISRCDLIEEGKVWGWNRLAWLGLSGSLTLFIYNKLENWTPGGQLSGHLISVSGLLSVPLHYTTQASGGNYSDWKLSVKYCLDRPALLHSLLITDWRPDNIMTRQHRLEVEGGGPAQLYIWRSLRNVIGPQTCWSAVIRDFLLLLSVTLSGFCKREEGYLHIDNQKWMMMMMMVFIFTIDQPAWQWPGGCRL